MDTNPLENPFYYLENFRQVLGWIAQRYDDLLDPVERDFIREFGALPLPAQGLLVRMVMRKGTLFRATKLSYVEIGDTRAAVQPLLALGWVDGDPTLDLRELFHLLRKDELRGCFKSEGKSTAGKGAERKDQWFERLLPLHDKPRTLAEWHPELDEQAFCLKVMPLCDRLRLLYFGNLYQEWSEFVLADLGIFRYETVDFTLDSRGIAERADIDVCLQLHACREALETTPDLASLAQQALAIETANPWLEMRRAKLLFRIGQQAERVQDWALALKVYRQSDYPGSRSRQIRVLERGAQYSEAMILLEEVRRAPRTDAEVQHLLRVLPRLQRKLGVAVERRAAARPVSRLDLIVEPVPGMSVEWLMREHLAEEGAEVHYVENTLINSLFGLLCWPAIFAPIPGAFFHPFHSAPADLHSPDFHERRASLFEQCFAELEDGRYLATIRERFVSKAGLQSPFVFWGSLSPQVLEQALHCLPPVHLRRWFERLLQDIKANRTGMPDLIKFYPQERRYLMIEVKGPGDRLQDNQLRWLDFCAEHGMPVQVCYVQWADMAEEPMSA